MHVTAIFCDYILNYILETFQISRKRVSTDCLACAHKSMERIEGDLGALENKLDLILEKMKGRGILVRIRCCSNANIIHVL